MQTKYISFHHLFYLPIKGTDNDTLHIIHFCFLTYIYSLIFFHRHCSTAITTVLDLYITPQLKFDYFNSKAAWQQCLYLYQSGAKKKKKAQKVKQFLSSYAKQSSICEWMKPGNSSLPEPCWRGSCINVGTRPGLFSQRPWACARGFGANPHEY